MAVSIVQQPQSVDFAYGPNFITLSGIGTAEKYYIRVRDWTTGDVIATMSQAPNQVNRAQFDLSKIFQQQVNVSSTDIEALGPYGNGQILKDSANETAYLRVEVGTITGGLVTIDSEVSPPKLTINGVKPYNLTANAVINRFRSRIQADDSSPACTTILQRGDILTNRPLNEFPSGVLPPSVDSGTDYLALKLSDSDMYTVTYQNNLQRVGLGIDILALGIEAFEICEINDVNGVINRTYIPNVAINGGGPNTTYQEGAAVLYPDEFITIGVGPANLQGLQYRDITNTSQVFTFNQNTDRYWVIPRAYTPAQCSQQYLSQATHDPVLVIFDNDPSCLEYPTVQASWLNQYGFRDYYNFTLKNEVDQRQVSNTFFREWNDYNDLSGGYGSGAGSGILEGGETVFNKSIDTQLKFNSKYLTDEESYYLAWMFKSSNVRLRTDSQSVSDMTGFLYWNTRWFPVVLTNGAYVEKTYRKNKLFQFEVQAKLAHNPQIQRGA